MTKEIRFSSNESNFNVCLPAFFSANRSWSNCRGVNLKRDKIRFKETNNASLLYSFLSFSIVLGYYPIVCFPTKGKSPWGAFSYLTNKNTEHLGRQKHKKVVLIISSKNCGQGNQVCCPSLELIHTTQWSKEYLWSHRLIVIALPANNSNKHQVQLSTIST